MKKGIIFLSLLVLLLSACSNKENNQTNENENQGKRITTEKNVNKEKNKEYVSILETEKKILISTSVRGFVRFYNPEDLELIKELPNICCTSRNALIEINKDRIEIGSVKSKKKLDPWG